MRILVAGALGEVGSSVSHALGALGHSVVPSTARYPLPDHPDVGSLAEGASETAAGRIDLIVNCGGRGDRRSSDRTGDDAVAVLPDAARNAGIPSVLISTTRVMEGYDRDYDEDESPLPRTPYALSNAAHEAAWLAAGGSSVLRITNYFSRPMSAASPQSLLLPWSLVTEALAGGAVGIRSGARLTKEFVSALDVATAVLALVAADSAPPICATVPGAPLSLRDLAEATSRALVGTGYAAPTVTYGPDGPPAPACRPGWLAEQGWRGGLTEAVVEQEIARWVVEWGHSHAR